MASDLGKLVITDDRHLPLCHFLFTDTLVVFDHVKHRLLVIANAYLEMEDDGRTTKNERLANAYADESPILAVTGEVQSDWEGRGSFQDGSGTGMNDVALMRPVTVFAQEVPAVSLLPHHLHVALRTMVGDSPRPVFLSLPQDLHERPVTEAYRPLQYGLATPPRVLDREAAAAARAFSRALAQRRCNADGLRRAHVEYSFGRGPPRRRGLDCGVTSSSWPGLSRPSTS